MPRRNRLLFRVAPFPAPWKTSNERGKTEGDSPAVAGIAETRIRDGAVSRKRTRENKETRGEEVCRWGETREAPTLHPTRYLKTPN